MIAEISATAQEQAKGIERINQTIVQMDAVTQQSAIQTVQFSTIAKSLAMQATELQNQAYQFKLGKEKDRPKLVSLSYYNLCQITRSQKSSAILPPIYHRFFGSRPAIQQQ